MATYHLKTVVETIPETSCISNVPVTMDCVQHCVSLLYQSLSQTFREQLAMLFCILEVHSTEVRYLHIFFVTFFSHFTLLSLP